MIKQFLSQEDIVWLKGWDVSIIHTDKEDRLLYMSEGHKSVKLAMAAVNGLIARCKKFKLAFVPVEVTVSGEGAEVIFTVVNLEKA